MRRYLVKFKEEIYNGARLTYHPRDDMQTVVEADTPREARKVVTAQVAELGLELVSCGFARNRELRVLIRQQMGRKPSPLLYRPNPQQLKVTGAGRIR